MITRHPSDGCLLAYAAGTLPEALAIVVATHAGRCACCRRTLLACEATGGALLEALPPAPLSDHALETVLARIGEPVAGVPPVLNPDLPAPLDRIALGRWWPIGPGIRWRWLRAEGAAWAGLILAQPGRSLPPHAHDGRELTCVLSGAFADGEGVYQAGDVAEPDGDHDPPPAVVARRRACACWPRRGYGCAARWAWRSGCLGCEDGAAFTIEPPSRGERPAACPDHATVVDTYPA